ATSETKANARCDQAMRPRPSSCATSLKRNVNRISERRAAPVRFRLAQNVTANPAILTASGTEPGAQALDAIASGKGELTFLGHPLEGFARTLDAILTIVALSRQLADHLIGAGGGRTRHIACSEIDA